MRVEQVFITPLVKNDTYGLEVDVSGYVKIDGLSKIKRSIDSTDYSLGVYTFDDLKLKCENALGTFNENDSRSIFPFTRDKAIVRVVALEIDSETFQTVSETQFEGIINDEPTRQNITLDTITLTVLSKDSVFRTTSVPAGLVPNGTTVKNAITSILSQLSITNVLTVLPDNILPDLDYIIDTASELDNLEVKKALNLLLPSSSSVLLLRDDVVFVQARENISDGEILNLKGRGEISNNANINSISSYNSGKQRQFNSVKLNDGIVVREDNNSITQYGLRQIPFDFPMVNNVDTLITIGDRILEEFRYPKIELKLRVPTQVSNGFDLLSIVKVDAPWLKKPMPEMFMPVLGVTKLGSIDEPLPYINGSVQILNHIKFKIISIADDPKTFVTILKLRQFGKNTNDGFFDESTFAILGQAILGQAILGKG